MNLSPDWCRVLREQGWEAAHWLDIGSGTAPDRDVMAIATHDKYIVFTHDLDFSAMLAATQANGPSIIQVSNSLAQGCASCRCVVDRHRAPISFV
jgi:predicted nuclease of predicted toxin-antitoxin system